jgi:hypothetical protein
MAEHAIDFDLGVEILRGPKAALEIHARRTKLVLDAMPDPYSAADHPARLTFEDACEITGHAYPAGLVSEVYDF